MTPPNFTACEAIAIKYAYMVCPSDITWAAKQIAIAINDEWQLVRAAILHALNNHRCTDVTATGYDQPNASPDDMCSESMIGNDRVYWWHNKAESRWSTTRPDWWPTPVRPS